MGEQRAVPGQRASGGSGARRRRRSALARYLELRPVVRSRMEAELPAELRSEASSVTIHQLRALVRLPDGGLSMRQLAEAMNVMGATASVLADRLVAQGLATRCPDPDDRRVVRLLPSDRGRELAALYRQAEQRWAESLFSRLSDRQVEAFIDVMETLASEEPPADHRSRRRTGSLEALR